MNCHGACKVKENVATKFMIDVLLVRSLVTRLFQSGGPV